MVDEKALLEQIQEACHAARQATLDSGRSVIESHEGWLVETFPDGSRRQIKKLPDRGQLSKGTIIKVKKKGLE